MEFYGYELGRHKHSDNMNPGQDRTFSNRYSLLAPHHENDCNPFQLESLQTGIGDGEVWSYKPDNQHVGASDFFA